MKSNSNIHDIVHAQGTGCRYIFGEVLKDPTHTCNYLNSEIQIDLQDPPRSIEN